MVKNAFTHDNKRIQPVNKPTFEQDREERLVEEARGQVKERESVSEPVVESVAAPVSQPVAPMPVEPVAESPVDRIFQPTVPQEPTEPETPVESNVEGESETISPVFANPVRPVSSRRNYYRLPAGSQLSAHPTTGETVSEEPVVENAYIREDQLPRRVSGRADEETYRQLKMLSITEDKPVWLIVATILRDTLVDKREFDMTHVPNYRKNRSSYGY